MLVDSSLIADRYQLIDRIGAGSMGEVWKARDLRFEIAPRFVALKLLKEDITRREDATNREWLKRALSNESSHPLTVESSSDLLHEVLQGDERGDDVRTRIEAIATATGGVRPDDVLALFDELVDNPSVCKNARLRAKVRRLFEHEANSVAALRHENIAGISDYGEHKGTLFLAMDYIEGETLQRVIQRGALNRVQRLRLMEDLCAGLAYAHKRRLVHRDIKPANLIIDDERQSLKILDFGVVRRLQDTGESTVGIPIGTLSYMSPEQIVGSASVDSRSDVFSVGVVFYELLTGRKAFPPREGFTELVARIQNSPPPPVRDLVPDIEPEILAILDRALEKSPDGRYQDLTEMQRDLSRVRFRLEADSEEQIRTLLIRGPKPAVDDAGPLIPRLLRQGERALEENSPTLARNCAEQILALDPSNNQALSLQSRAQARLRLRQVQLGLERGRPQLDAGDLTAARATWQQLVAIDPESNDVAAFGAAVAQAEGKREQTRRRIQQVRLGLERGRPQLDAGDLTAARATWQQLTTIDPQSDDVAAFGAAVTQAEEEREQTRLRIQGVRLGLERGRPQLDAGDLTAARATWQQLTAIDPQSNDVAAFGAAVTQAEEELEQTRLRIQEVQLGLERGRSQLGAGDLTAARATWQQLVTIDSDSGEIAAFGAAVAQAEEEREQTRARIREAEEAAAARDRRETEMARLLRRADELVASDEIRLAIDMLTPFRSWHPKIATRLAELEIEQEHRQWLAQEQERLLVEETRAREAEANRQQQDATTDTILKPTGEPALGRHEAEAEGLLTDRATEDPGIATELRPLEQEETDRGGWELDQEREADAKNRSEPQPQPHVKTSRPARPRFKWAHIAVAGIVVLSMAGVTYVAMKGPRPPLATGGPEVPLVTAPPSDERRPIPPASSTVTVDMLPWARVRIVGHNDVPAPDAEFTTPFTVALPPGTYTLQAENGGLTRGVTFDITVVAGEPQRVIQAMPGFDTKGIVDQILGDVH